MDISDFNPFKVIRKGVDIVAEAADDVVGIVGDAIEFGSDAAGEAVGMVSDRGKEIIRGAGRSVSSIVKTPSKLATTAARTAVGVVTGLADTVMGNEDGADEALDLAHKGIDEVSDHFDEMSTRVSKTAKAWTGESEFEKAKKSYLDLAQENRKMYRTLKSRRKELNEKIDGEVEAINADRLKAQRAFNGFVHIVRVITDCNIAKYKVADVYVGEQVKLARISTEAKVFEGVDFDREPGWNRFIGAVTGGLATTFKIDDAKDCIKYLRRSAKYHWRQDEAHNLKCERVAEALKEVRENFDEFVVVYRKLQRVLKDRLSGVRRVSAAKLDKKTLKILNACDKLTIILLKMTSRSYLTVSKNMPAVVASDKKLVTEFKSRQFKGIERLVA